MSGYLLDTNILIAFLNKTVERLPRRIGQLLASLDTQPVVSVVSPWEISIKRAAGKLQLGLETRDLVAAMGRLGFTVLPMTIDHAVEVAHPEPATRDPFDRLLLAVCACEGLKLVTTDAKLAGHRLVY